MFIVMFVRQPKDRLNLAGMLTLEDLTVGGGVHFGSMTHQLDVGYFSFSSGIYG
jgi:hypothetical protein